MNAKDAPHRAAPRVASAAPRDPEILRSGSVLIYCRSSFTLTLLVFASLAAKLYSDLYAHLIRQSGRSLARGYVLPGALFALLSVGVILLAVRARPRVERAALFLLAANLAVFLLRQRAGVHTDAYLILCTLSILLDLGLLAAVIVFYRTYPNLLKTLRSPADVSSGGVDVRRARKAP